MNLVKRLKSTHEDFHAQLEQLLARDESDEKSVRDDVAAILRDVRTHGDEALCRYTTRFDGWACSPEKLEIPRPRLEKALADIADADRRALELAMQRIRAFHERQKPKDWHFKDSEGFLLGQRVTALQRVGIYVPGGKAAYPSSVLMNAIPAKVAGVDEIIMAVPTPLGSLNELVLAAAMIAGVDRVFAIGGAQAIAAMAYGTWTIPKVDKIVGPGNRYVAEAKRQVFGQCGIDMIAGPSEIVVVADDGNPDWLAADLLSQAEHDECAQSILISTNAELIEDVERSIAALLERLPRKDITSRALSQHGALIHVRDYAEAAEVVNLIAPEHLELAMNDPDLLLPYIRNAGAIFLGKYTPEAVGDYIAGPNHVLPTNRTARFSSPLGVYDFIKFSSVIRAEKASLEHLGDTVVHLARREGLPAHAESIILRLKESA